VNAAGADGLLAGHPGQLGVQAVAVLVTMALSATLTAAIIATLRAVMAIRVSLGDELVGLDASDHGEEAYHVGDVGELAGGAPLGGVILIQPEEAPVTASAA